jgi:hypothetical protein
MVLFRLILARAGGRSVYGVILVADLHTYFVNKYITLREYFKIFYSFSNEMVW